MDPQVRLETLSPLGGESALAALVRLRLLLAVHLAHVFGQEVPRLALELAFGTLVNLRGVMPLHVLFKILPPYRDERTNRTPVDFDRVGVGVLLDVFAKILLPFRFELAALAAEDFVGAAVELDVLAVALAPSRGEFAVVARVLLE